MELTVVASPLLGTLAAAPAALQPGQINNLRAGAIRLRAKNNKQLNEEN
jgi:hypothetical protein